MSSTAKIVKLVLASRHLLNHRLLTTILMIMVGERRKWYGAEISGS